MDPEDQLKPEEVGYKIRDFDGNIIDKRQARKIIQEKFPSVSKKRRDEKERKNKSKSSKQLKGKTQKQKNENQQNERESTASQKSLSDQPRQFPRLDRDNSSMKSRETLPISTILKDTFPELFLQYKFDSDCEKFKEFGEISKDQIQNVMSVDKLSKGRIKKAEKKLDNT